MTDLDLRERTELADLLDELGPDAPTLCEGWNTKDLAAHLVVRERRPIALPGILIDKGVLGRKTAEAMETELRRGYPAVVDRVRKVPPGIFSVAAIRRAVNLAEYIVHHEDVRRANGMAPRDRPDLNKAVWSLLTTLLRVRFVPNFPGPVAVKVTDPADPDRSFRFGRGSRTVTLSGRPVELLLWLFGRRGAAQVDIIGEREDVAQLGLLKL